MQVANARGPAQAHTALGRADRRERSAARDVTPAPSSASPAARLSPCSERSSDDRLGADLASAEAHLLFVGGAAPKAPGHKPAGEQGDITCYVKQAPLTKTRRGQHHARGRARGLRPSWPRAGPVTARAPHPAPPPQRRRPAGQSARLLINHEVYQA